MKRSSTGALFALLMVAPTALALLTPTAAAEPVYPGLDVFGTRVFKDASFILTDNVTVEPGATLVLDNVSIQYRFDVDNSRWIRVLPGGALIIVNNTRIYSQFRTPAFSLHYRVWTAPGAHFVLQNSTIDYAYFVGVGDESAIIENSTISNALMGLFGWNLTVNNMRFLGTNVGLWVSGHSVVHNATFAGATVYHAILDGTARVENSTFTGADTADLLMMENSSAWNNTHRASNRAAIVNQNATIGNADIADELASGIQVGAEDLRYGCGIYMALPWYGWPNPSADWLNLHAMHYYQRWDNRINLQDVSIRSSPTAIEFGREVWRNANLAQVMDDCQADPPPQDLGPPFVNMLTTRVTKDTAWEVRTSVYNGSINVQAGATFAVRGADWRFLTPGEPAFIQVDGGSLVVEGSRITSGKVDFVADRINETQAVAPTYDLRLNAGFLSIRNTTLLHLGTSTNPAVDAGIVVAQGAQPVEVSNSAIIESSRGITVGCCAVPTTLATRVTVEGTEFATDGPALVLHGGITTLLNSTIASSGASPVHVLGTSGELHLYSTLASPQGPGTISVFRYGFVQVRAVWEDLRPAGGVTITVTDFPGGNVLANLTAGSDGWITPQYLLWRTTTWDGVSEQGQAPRLFTFSTAAGGATATTLPTDISVGATITLALPDDRVPTVSLDLPEAYYSNVSGGVVTGVAQDFETGITVVELSLDGGPFFSVLTPTAPLLGQVPFNFTLTGLTEAVHVLLVRAWDSVGNTAEASAYFVVDQHFPSVSDFSFDLLTNHRMNNLTGRLSEPGTITIKGNTTNASLLDGSFVLPLYMDLDSEYMVVSVRDLAGNAHDYPFVARFDDVPPLISVNSPVNGTWTTQSNVTLSGSIEFNALLALNGVPLTVSGTTSFTIRAALTEGENLLVLTATDAAGNSRSVQVTIFFDAGAPALDILGPDPLRTLASPNITLRLRTEAGAVVTVTVAGNTTMLTAASDLVDIPLHLAEGRSLLSIKVTDQAGNEVLRGIAFTVDTSVPTIAFLRGNETSTTNETFFLRGLTEPNAVIVIGGYTTQADSAGSFALPLHLHAGANVIAVTSTDSAGNSGSAVYTVTVADPPRAADAGLAAPAGGPMMLLILGAVMLVALPFAVRTVQKRRQ